MHKEVSFAKDLIVLIDSLVTTKNIAGLKSLHKLNMSLILNNVIDPIISITELNEYIEEAIIQLERATDPDSIMKAENTFTINKK